MRPAEQGPPGPPQGSPELSPQEHFSWNLPESPGVLPQHPRPTNPPDALPQHPRPTNPPDALPQHPRPTNPSDALPSTRVEQKADTVPFGIQSAPLEDSASVILGKERKRGKEKKKKLSE